MRQVHQGNKIYDVEDGIDGYALCLHIG